MKNIYIYCEGATEETFINEVLYPYFFNMGIVVRPIICTTKRTNQKKFKGGVSDYNKIKSELTILCKSHHNELITTMFDYYAMPDNTPGIDNQETDIVKRIEAIEDAINTDIGLRNCSFHFMLHEFEGILFSNPASFNLIADDNTVEKIQKIRDTFPTPEHINNAPDTAPSKRLAQLIPGYAKVRNGAVLSKDMGIDTIMRECPHFCDWIKKIAAIANASY
ncbi:MAG: DUF4276 family protein [Firmicutes bacterium]|nr:DUF4276 family protein [Bacillota bacterium]